MAQTLTPEAIAALLAPYLAEAPRADADWPRICAQLAAYLDLILKWNARTNLTAIRAPEEIVRRHFGESLFAGLHLDFPTLDSPTLDSQTLDSPMLDSPTLDSRTLDSPTDAAAAFGGVAALGDIAALGKVLPARSTLLDYGSGAGLPGLPIQLLRPELEVTLAESQGKKAAFLREAVRTLGLAAEVWAARVEAMPPQRQFDTVVLRAVDRMDLALGEAARRAARRVAVLATARAASTALGSGFHLREPIRLPQSDEAVLLIADRISLG